MVIETGIDNLDEELKGGIEEGSVVSFIADPMFQGDTFLRYFLSQESTVYFSTNRSTSRLRKIYENIESETNFIDIRSSKHIGYTPSKKEISEKSDYIINYIIKKIKEISDKKIIIFDTFSDIMGKNEWEEVLYTLSDIVENSSSVAYLYIIRKNSNIEKKVLRICDVIFNVELEIVQNDLRTYLSIPKIRQYSPINKVLRINMDRKQISIDTSREV